MSKTVHMISPRFFSSRLLNVFTKHIRMSSNNVGGLGSGAGKGGGGGGSIRSAGGAFGKRQAALEERYFKEKEQEQIAALKKSRQEIINHHKKQIEDLQKEIRFHERKLEKLIQHESE